MAQVLDGKIVARKILEQAAADIENLRQKNIFANLAIVVAGSDPSTMSYVNAIVKAAEKTGIKTQLEQPDAPSQEELELIVEKLANDEQTHGIMVQTPLPEYIDAVKLTSLIPPTKDVDGASPLSAGLLSQKAKCFVPATAGAVIEILDYYNLKISGKNAVVVGRSNIVGKPVAQLLLNQNATLSICHSKSTDITSLTKQADLLLVAIGKSKFITKDFVASTQIVIDVGTNFDESGKMTGDVNFDQVEPKVQAITPVPGGVGPVTTAVLLKQVCQAAERSL